MGEFCAGVPGATPDAFRAASGAEQSDLVNDAEGTPLKASAKAKAKDSSSGRGKSKEVSLDLYEINSRGEITSALGRLLQAGFSVGSTVTLRSHGDKVWVVGEASGENVEVHEAGVPKTAESTLLLLASTFSRARPTVRQGASL